MSFFLIILVSFYLTEKILAAQQTNNTIIALPKPDVRQGMPLNSALKSRRSHRRFSDKAVPLSALSQLLWSAQGVTHLFGFRTAPSAGAIHPLELYVAATNVDQLQPGIYHYEPGSHSLRLIVQGDHRTRLVEAANKQGSIKKAPATLVITAVFSRTEKKYGKRAERYVHIESGSVAQNIYLQAASLQLNTVFTGSFNDMEVIKAMQLPEEHEPIGLMPIGHRP
jgi:SagB-type dehydrogenase family enzyme